MNDLMRKEDRKSRKRMAREAAKLRLRAPGVMVAAKKQLASYCRLNSISDAECQRIADRINYEHSEKNHLRNPKVSATEKLKLERSKATDAEFARLQAKAAEEAEWYYLKIGEIIKGGDEQNSGMDENHWIPVKRVNIGYAMQTLRFRRRAKPPVEEWRMLEIGEEILATDEQTHRVAREAGMWFPVCRINVGAILKMDDLKFRRRITPTPPAPAIPKQAADVPEGWHELFDDELDGRWIDGAKWKYPDGDPNDSPENKNWRYAAYNGDGAYAESLNRIIVPITP